MDLTHCGWSDIFFLGMDFPEGARVLNISVNLGVHGRDAAPRPPVEAYFRVIDEPVIRLASVDLEATATLSSLDDVFDFGRDYLGLLKAAVIAAGLVPPGIERSGASLAELLATIFGPGRGFELVSNVNRIPKGSRLAVSTNLLGALIGVCMRATGQIRALSGPSDETERRIVAARAILGEWIGGSGGGWQDSGGLWPGIKLIEGAPAAIPNSASAAAVSSRATRFSAATASQPRLGKNSPIPSCSSTAVWPKTSAPSSRWPPRNISSAANPSSPPAAAPSPPSTTFSRSFPQVTSAASAAPSQRISSARSRR
jgi:hypothetical protein